MQGDQNWRGSRTLFFMIKIGGDTLKGFLYQLHLFLAIHDNLYKHICAPIQQ
jgi:hypothetical protein